MKKLFLLVVLLLALACSLHAATKNLVPNATGDGGLGTATKQWREVNAATGAFSGKLTLSGAPVATTNQAGVIALDVAQRVVETNSASSARTPISGLTNHSEYGENIVALRSRDFGFQWYDLVNSEPLAEFLYDGFTFHKTIVSEGDAHFAVMPIIGGTNLGTLLADTVAARMAASAPSTDQPVTAFTTSPVNLTNKVMTLTATADVHLTHSTNRTAGVAQYTSIYLYAGVTNRLVSFNTNWVLWGCGPTNLVASNRWCAVHLMGLGTAENNVHVRFDTQ
jgi:hypothetical protein